MQRLNRSVDICPVISASCPIVVQNPPDMCLRPDIASVYDPSSCPTPTCQGPFYNWDRERVLEGVQFNTSMEETFEILNGAARPKFHQNGADVGCSNHAPTITTPALSRPDAIILFLFSLVVYLAGYIYRLLGRRRGTPTNQQAGVSSHVSSDCCICPLSTFFLMYDCLTRFRCSRRRQRAGQSHQQHPISASGLQHRFLIRTSSQSFRGPLHPHSEGGYAHQPTQVPLHPGRRHARTIPHSPCLQK